MANNSYNEYKNQMVERANVWLKAWEAGEADTTNLEMAAEYLMEAAKADPFFDKEELEDIKELVDRYNTSFGKHYLKCAIRCLLEELAA